MSVVDESKLEELGQLIMAASVKAEFLGLPSVVNALDLAFSDVVRFVVEAKQKRAVEAQKEKMLESEEG